MLIRKKKYRQILKIGNLIGYRKTRLNFWVILVLSGGAYFAPQPMEKKLKSQIEKLEKQLENAQKKEPELRAKIQAEMFVEGSENRVALYPQNTALEEAEPSFAKEIGALIKNHIKGIWIESVTFNRQTYQCKISAYTVDPSIVDDYVGNIKADEVLAPYNLKLGILKEAPYAAGQAVAGEESQKKEEAAGSSSLHTYHFTLASPAGGGS